MAYEGWPSGPWFIIIMEKQGDLQDYNRWQSMMRAAAVTTGMYITRTSLRIQQQHAKDGNLQKKKTPACFRIQNSYSQTQQRMD